MRRAEKVCRCGSVYAVTNKGGECPACKSKRMRNLRAANLDKYRRRDKEYYSPERRREQNLRRFYGMGADDYERILSTQGGGCAICGTTRKAGKRGSLPVDHDHRTGKVRGILCSNCNTAIGLLGDDAARARLVAAYLEGHARRLAG